ncbi:MAG: hypothetical protein MUO21_11690 [Nitrososphaeraceae archaeon]|nr:hypothetical protein [Nitrososphaeraceae archaeon]
MVNRKALISAFSGLSIIFVFMTIAGVWIYEPTNYRMDSIVYFGVTGTITLICIGVTIYNIVKLIKENRQYSPLVASVNTADIYD